MDVPHSGVDSRPAHSTTVVGVVLAAGAGRRYGVPKIVAEQGLWLRRAIEALQSGGCDRVVVTMGPIQVPLPPGVDAVPVPQYRRGLSESVRAGLRAAAETGNPQGIVLHVVDTPATGGDVVRRVIEASGRTREALVRATFHGAPGHPVYVGVNHVGALGQSLGGDRGARDYLRESGVYDIECADLAPGTDIDWQR